MSLCGIGCGCNNQNLDLVGIATGNARVGKAQGISGTQTLVWPGADKHEVDGPFDSNERSTEELLDRIGSQVIYVCAPDVDVHFVQGDKAHEVCDPDPVTAEYVQSMYDALKAGGYKRSADGRSWVPPVNEYATKYHQLVFNHVTLTKEEATLIRQMSKGVWVGPPGQAVLDKLDAVIG